MGIAAATLPVTAAPASAIFPADEPHARDQGRRGLFADVDRLVEVPITLDPTVTVGTPRVVLDANAMRPFVSVFDVTPDGKSFLMVQRVQAPEQPTGMVSGVLNWAEEFRAKSR